MPTYTYKARDAAGKPVKGVMEAFSKDELTQKLHKLGYMTTQAGESLPELKFELVLGRLQRVGSEDLAMFLVQLSDLLNAGISLLSSLDAIGKQIENKKLREIVGDVSRNVEAGESFSEALASHPKVFSKLFLSMVRAGEASGKLDTILARFAVYSEEQAELRQKIKGTLFYPLILLFAGIGVTLFIVAFIIPQFAEIFMKAGLQLPLPTLILYGAGMSIRQFWHSMLLMIAAVWVGVEVYTNTPSGRFQFDWLKLKLPLASRLYRKAAISRFARTLGMLLSSAVPILDSLEIVRDVVNNEVLSRAIENARNAVEKGEKISEPLRISGEFPPDTIQMIAVGEESGNLDEMLDKVSDFYDRSIGYTVKKLTTVLEPLLLAVMGCLVGFIMASMLLPMFDMIKILRH